MFNSKFAFALAALAAAAQAAQVSSVVPEYVPMQNPGEELCIVKGDFKKDTESYAIELAACDAADVALLKSAGEGKELRTKGGLCLDTLTNSSDADVEIVLRECPETIKDKGLKWTSVGKDQWQNGYKKCMKYNNETELIVQAECVLDKDVADEKSPQQFVFLEPPMAVCIGAWSKNWVCASGYVLDGTPGLTCVGGTGAECANVCCVPAKTCYSQGYGKCAAGFKPVNRQCDNYNQPACSWNICCEPETTCKSAGFYNRCPADYQFVDRKCGNPGQPACDWTVCCDPKPITCGRWDSCSREYALKLNADNIWCTRGAPMPGSKYPQCSDNSCCDKTIQQTTCGYWNQCDAGYEVKPNAYNKRCWIRLVQDGGVMPISASANEWCSNDYCCQQKTPPPPPPNTPSDCAASWTCDASTGRVPKPNSDSLQCYPARPGSLNPRCGDQFCCEQDTCKAWSQRVVEVKFGAQLTGEDVCNDNPSQWAGLKDPSSPQFTQPCVDQNGRQVVCKPDICCNAA